VKILSIACKGLAVVFWLGLGALVAHGIAVSLVAGEPVFAPRASPLRSTFPWKVAIRFALITIMIILSLIPNRLLITSRNRVWIMCAVAALPPYLILCRLIMDGWMDATASTRSSFRPDIGESTVQPPSVIRILLRREGNEKRPIGSYLETRKWLCEPGQMPLPPAPATVI